MLIKDNSGVCCLGDSITHIGKWIYNINGYLAENKVNIKLYNCGIGGNVVSNAPYLLADDVLWLNPDYVIIMYGANDVGQDLYRESVWKKSYTQDERKREIEKNYEKYIYNMRITCDLLRQRGAEPILMTAPPFDCNEYEESSSQIFYGINDEMKRYADGVKRLAQEEGIKVIDIFAEMSALLGNIDGLYGRDRIHPADKGMHIMSAVILKEMGFDIKIPENDADIEKLPFKKTVLNDARLETEAIVRECAGIDWLHFAKDKSLVFTDDKSAGLIKEMMPYEGRPDWQNEQWFLDWIPNVSATYAKYRGRRDELRRLLIKQTDMMFDK